MVKNRQLKSISDIMLQNIIHQRSVVARRDGALVTSKLNLKVLQELLHSEGAPTA